MSANRMTEPIQHDTPAASGNRSLEWMERLQRVMPFGSSTCSKKAEFPPEEPGVIVRGKGCRVWDADGREYIDFRNSLGPITLGYGFPAVDDAIREQLDIGIAFGHPHPLEGEVAEMVCARVPCAEQARFLKTGGEAVAACIRIARGFTGRDHVIQIGYNGWLNSLASDGVILPGRATTSAPRGVPAALSELHHWCEWDNVEKLDAFFARYPGQIAAVVVAADYQKMARGAESYPALRERCDRHGALLVFDEIVTGFRVALAGVQEYFGVTPDLAVFAKGIANGMPLSVYCGKRNIMKVCEEGVFITSTLGGELLSLAAARAALNVIDREHVIAHLWRQGEALWGGLNRLFEKHGIAAKMEGLWPCPILVYRGDSPKDLRWRFLRAAFRNGVSLGTVSYVNFSHKDSDIAETLERLEAAILEIKT